VSGKSISAWKDKFMKTSRSIVAAHDPSKRHFMRLAGTGATGIVLGGMMPPISLPSTPEPACSAKSVGAEVRVAETFLKVVAIELPSQKPIIDKIIKVADDFNADYQRGDFKNAASIFATLEGDVTQLISDLGVNVSQRIKVALVLVDAAITAIGELLNSQKGAVVVNLMNATPAEQAKAAAIERRAARVDKLFRAIH